MADPDIPRTTQSDWHPGDRVEHDDMGPGPITAVTGDGVMIEDDRTYPDPAPQPTVISIDWNGLPAWRGRLGIGAQKRAILLLAWLLGARVEVTHGTE